MSLLQFAVNIRPSGVMQALTCISLFPQVYTFHQEPSLASDENVWALVLQIESLLDRSMFQRSFPNYFSGQRVMHSVPGLVGLYFTHCWVLRWLDFGCTRDLFSFTRSVACWHLCRAVGSWLTQYELRTHLNITVLSYEELWNIHIHTMTCETHAHHHNINLASWSEFCWTGWFVK